jgi:hypothetical protein
LENIIYPDLIFYKNIFLIFLLILLIFLNYFFSDTWPYSAPELKKLIKKKVGDVEEKVSAEKGDIFALAVTAFCLLFYEV